MNDFGKAVMAHLSKMLGGRPLLCAVCGGSRWDVNDHLLVSSLRPVPDGEPVKLGTTIIGGGLQIPMVIVVCSHCGNTHFINLLRAGILTERAPQDFHVERGGKIADQALGGGS